MPTNIQPINIGSNTSSIKKSSTETRLYCSLPYTSEQNFDAVARSQAAKSAGELVLQITSNLLGVSKVQLLNRSRSKAHICVARQCAMYLLHTSFSLNYCEVADFFGRDRTTVSHACRIVEDLRDDETFDERLVRLEDLAEAAKKLQIFNSVEVL